MQAADIIAWSGYCSVEDCGNSAWQLGRRLFGHLREAYDDIDPWELVFWKLEDRWPRKIKEEENGGYCDNKFRMMEICVLPPCPGTVQKCKNG